MNFDTSAIKRYLSGKFSFNDKMLVDEIFENDSHSVQLNELLKEQWEDFVLKGETATEKDLSAVYENINQRISRRTSRKKGTIRGVWQLYKKVAAILLLPLAIASLYYFFAADKPDTQPAWVEIHSPYGARTKFLLPDGSSGWLNGGSVIGFPAQFGETRSVTLNGEAYFDVAKNEKSPFVINANPIKIKVLGTSFDVVSYDNDSISEVTVASGKVEIEAEGHDFAHELLPSERLVMDRTKNKFTKSVVDIQNFTSWKNGRLMFMNDDLNEAIRKVSRFYNVDFEVAEDVDRNSYFRAILEKESLEEVLRYMKLTMSIDYKIEERVLGKDSRVSKRKVIISNNVKTKRL